jgi:ArsR family transcriptional regulator
MEIKTAVTALGALAQDSRLSIFRALVQAGPSGLSVGDIGASLNVAPATLSFHLKELVHAGLIASRQEGRFIFYAANYARMDELLGFMTENCCAKDGAACLPSAKAKCAPAKSKQRARTR